MKLSLKKIKTIAVDKGITLSELADRVGTSRQNLNGMIRRNNATAEMLMKISQALGVELNDLINVYESDQAPESFAGEPAGSYLNESQILFMLRDRVENMDLRLRAMEKVVKENLLKV